MPTASQFVGCRSVLLCDFAPFCFGEKLDRQVFERLAAGDLAKVINRSRSATSQHLKVLRDIGVVVPARNGNVVRYTLSDEVNGQVIEEAVSAFDQMQTIRGGEGGEQVSTGV